MSAPTQEIPAQPALKAGAIVSRGSTPHKLLHLSDRPVLCVPVGGEE